MKRVLVALCAAFVVAAGFVPVSAGDQDFTLRNRTGYTIDEVYVSPANDDSWGEDVLGRDNMTSDENVEIKFSRSEPACVWDMKVVFHDEEEAVWQDFNLCKVEEITLHYDNKKTTATYK